MGPHSRRAARNANQGRIASAGLDVYEDKPNGPAALMRLDNVVLLPHIPGNTEETRRAMAERVMANLREFFRDGQLVSAAPMPPSTG